MRRAGHIIVGLGGYIEDCGHALVSLGEFVTTLGLNVHDYAVRNKTKPAPRPMHPAFSSNGDIDKGVRT